jgi:hypothetical protein
MISRLIERGANLSAKNNYGATVLHSACSRKRLETVLELLRCGASVSIRDNDGLTPFHTLCSSFVTIEDQNDTDPSKTVEIQIANALISAGAEINSPYVFDHRLLTFLCDLLANGCDFIVIELAEHLFITACARKNILVS